MTKNADTYITRDGDTVDLIVFQRFGTHGSEAALFAANPGLADYGAILPAGVIVNMPAVETPQTVTSKKLWG